MSIFDKKYYHKKTTIMEHYIVRNGNEYQVEEHEEKPANVVLCMPNNPYGPSSFTLAETNVGFVLKSFGSNLVISYNDKIIKSLICSSLIVACDYLNKYKLKTDNELKEELIQWQNKRKSFLEQEIERLEIKRNELNKVIDISLKLKNKISEMDRLIAQIKNKT